MIDKSVKIVPGMRFSTGTQIRTVAKVVPGDPYPIVWDGDGDDADTEEGFRSYRTLVDQPAPSDAAKQPERKVACGWIVPLHAPCLCKKCGRNAAWYHWYHLGACLDCAESMGVYESLAAAETTAERGRAALSPAETASAKAEVGASTPAAATYSVVIDERVNFGPKEWAEVQRLVSPKCPCERMNLRDLSGDPVCYCTERPKEPIRVVGYYASNWPKGENEYEGGNWHQTGVATGLHLEARRPTLTDELCERAALRYPSTCDNEPSGA